MSVFLRKILEPFGTFFMAVPFTIPIFLLGAVVYDIYERNKQNKDGQ